MAAAGQTSIRRWALAIGAVALLGAIAYAAWIQRPGSRGLNAPALKEVTVAHWGTERILIYAPLYVALDGGFFRQQGLNVKISYSGNDDQVFATVASGAAQFGVGDPAFTAISREKGGRGRVIASLVTGLTNWGVTNKQNIPTIINPGQLAGLRVTSFPPPSTTYTILSQIKKENSLDSMQIVPTPFGGELAALQNNAADLAILLEPQTSLAAQNGYRVVWSLAQEYGPFLLTGVSTTDSEIASDPQTVQEFVNALQAAIVLMHTNREKTVGILQKGFPTLSSQILESAVNRLVQDGAVPASAAVDEVAWKKVLEPRVAVGDLKSLANGLSAADNRFADAAIAEATGQKKRN